MLQICDFRDIISLQGVLSHFHHCGRMAIYNNNQKIGVKATTRNTANNWNQKDLLRAPASFITQIKTESHNKNIMIAVRNRTELSKIVFTNHSAAVNGFQITSVIFQLHSKILTAA